MWRGMPNSIRSFVVREPWAGLSAIHASSSN